MKRTLSICLSTQKVNSLKFAGQAHSTPGAAPHKGAGIAGDQGLHGVTKILSFSTPVSGNARRENTYRYASNQIGFDLTDVRYPPDL